MDVCADEEEDGGESRLSSCESLKEASMYEPISFRNGSGGETAGPCWSGASNEK